MMLNIRGIQQKDIGVICLIEQACFSDPWSMVDFETTIALEHTLCLVVELDEQVIGYCCLYLCLDEGELVKVAVTPDYRSRGIAKTLLEELERQCIEKRLTQIFLEVRESNIEAKRLYQRLDYKELSIRKNLYRNPTEHGVLMKKQI